MMMVPDWAATLDEALAFPDMFPVLRFVGDDVCDAVEPHLGQWLCSRRAGHGGRHTAAMLDGTVVACWTHSEPTA